MASTAAESSPPGSRITARDVIAFLSSFAGHVAPKHLVQLKLEANRQAIGQDPVRKLARGLLLGAWREQHLAPPGKGRQFVAAPVVVGAIADHELDLLFGAQ